MEQSGVRRYQQGVGLWGLIFIFAVIAFVALVAIKVVPIYLNQMKIAAAVKEVAQDPKLGRDASPGEIRDILQRHWDIDDIADIQPRDILIRRTDQGQRISYDYEARTHLFYNVFIVIHFEGGKTLRGSG